MGDAVHVCDFDVRQALACRSVGDKLKESLIKVRLKVAFAPSLWEGLSYGKEKSKYSCAQAFSPRGDLFWVSTRSCAPPLTPPKGREIYNLDDY